MIPLLFLSLSILFTFIERVSTETDMITWCQKNPEVQDPTTSCFIKQTKVCDQDLIFGLSSDKVSKDTYTIVFNESVINCTTNKFTIKNRDSEGKVIVSNLVLVFENSTLYSKNISLDSGTSEESQIKLINSSLNSSQTMINASSNPTLRPSFTGSCLPPDEYSDSGISSIWSNSYGQITIPKGSNINENGDVLVGADYFGTGGTESATSGGGRVFIRTRLLVIGGVTGTGIFSNANMNVSEKEQDKGYGTGGVVILAIHDYYFKDGPKEPVIQCRGANSTETVAGPLFGGGGRVFVSFESNSSNLMDIVGYVDVGNTEIAKPDPKFYGQPGTVYVQNPTKAALFITTRYTQQKLGTLNCLTVLNSSRMKHDPQLDFSIEASGTSKIVYINEESSPEIAIPNINLSSNSSFIIVPTAVTADENPTIFKLNFITINGATLIPTSNISFSMSGGFTLTNKGSILFPPINYPDSLKSSILLQVIAPLIEMNGSSSISNLGSSTKKNTTSSLLLTPTETFKAKDYSITADKIIIQFPMETDSVFTISNAVIKSIDNYCFIPNSPTDPSYYLKRYHSLSQRPSPNSKTRIAALLSEMTQKYLDTYRSMLVIIGKNVNVVQSNLTDIGYIGMTVTNELTIDSTSNLSTNASGCSPIVLPIQSTSSKYIKICKVIGGNNVGRGTLGAQKNFENCKYVLSSAKNNGSVRDIAAGYGGQKNHQMESDKSGFGGGVVAIWANTLKVRGNVFADGGPFSERDYTMIAGGSGGTIAYTASKMELQGVASCRGGLSSAEVESCHEARRRGRREAPSQLHELGRGQRVHPGHGHLPELDAERRPEHTGKRPQVLRHNADGAAGKRFSVQRE